MQEAIKKLVEIIIKIYLSLPDDIKKILFKSVIEIFNKLINETKRIMINLINRGFEKIDEKLNKDKNDVKAIRIEIIKSLQKERELYKHATEIRAKDKHKCNIYYYKGQLSMIKIMNERNKENKDFVDDIKKDNIKQTKIVFNDVNKTLNIIEKAILKGDSIEVDLESLQLDKLDMPKLDKLENDKKSKKGKDNDDNKGKGSV